MPTRIILHGGNSAKSSQKNAKFYREIIKGVPGSTVRVLCVYFARPEHRWAESYEEDQSQFKGVGTEKTVETTLATYSQFVDQISQADVVFMNGGIKGHLKPALLVVGLERFRQMLEGKTLVGISAGAHVLAKYYYSLLRQEIREGIGLLNIKLITHYAGESDALEQLKAYGEDLPIVTIAEEEFVVINQGEQA